MAWAGNGIADQAAKMMATSLAPPSQLVEDRAHFQDLHLKACKLIAVVQEAHMYAVRQAATTSTPKVRPELARKRKRMLPNLVPRSGKRRRRGALQPEAGGQQPNSTQEEPDLSLFNYVQHQAAKWLTEGQLHSLLWTCPGEGREGLHQLVVADGPPGPPGSGTRPNGTKDVLLRCANCSAKASNTGNWTKLAKSFCTPKHPGWQWKQHAHVLMPDVGGSSCIHCGLRTVHSHRQHPQLAICPCDTLWDGPDEIIEGSILLRGVLGLRSCWTAWYKGPHESGHKGVEHPNQGQALAHAPPLLSSYLSHVGHSVSSCHFCLRCGKLPRDNRKGFQEHMDGMCHGPGAPISATVSQAVLTECALGKEVPLAPRKLQLLHALEAHCQDLHTPPPMGATAAPAGTPEEEGYGGSDDIPPRGILDGLHFPEQSAHDGHTAHRCHFCLRCGAVPTGHGSAFRGDEGPCEGMWGRVPESVVSALAGRGSLCDEEPGDPLRRARFLALVSRCTALFRLRGTDEGSGCPSLMGAVPSGPPVWPGLAHGADGAGGRISVDGFGEVALQPSQPAIVRARGPHPGGEGPQLAVALHRSKRHCAGPGPGRPSVGTGRASLWAAFARGAGPLDGHAVVADCPVGQSVSEAAVALAP